LDRARQSGNAAQSVSPAPNCLECGAPLDRAVPEQELCDACQGLIAPDPDVPAQERVAGHRLVRKLGAGRFSTSCLAEAPSGGGVVLKLLRAEAATHLDVPQFLAEAARLAESAALDQEGVARLLDAGAPADGEPFLVYETGGEFTLADELRAQGQVILPRALELCAQLAEGLDAVHAAGILHLDLKPANVGLADGEDGNERAVLLDAATSHLLGHPPIGDASGLPLSTAAYLSPEQARGEPPAGAADFYALGVLLYQLVTGGLPVYGSTSGELIRAHRDQRPLRLRDGGSRVNPDLEAALARMLDKDPARRYTNGVELAAALRALAREPDTREPDTHELGIVPKSLPAEPEWSSAPEASPAHAAPAKVAAARVADITYGPRAPPDVEEALADAMLDGNLPRPPKGRRRPVFRLRAPRLPRWASPAWLTPLAFALLLAASATLAWRSNRTPAPSVELAQTLLGQGQPAEAKRTLKTVLARPDIEAQERAQATLLMATAHEAAGEKQSAIAWYRRYIKLAKDPHERTRAARRIRVLSR
jgi:serine/threonine-protein kinase